MPYIKKLSFAPLFLIIFSFTSYQIAQIINYYQVLFSLESTAIVSILILTSLFLLSGLSFILLATFANDWKLIIPVIIVALSLPFIFIPQPLSFIIGIGFLIAFVTTSFSLENKLKSYLTFRPTELLVPPIKSLSSFLILVTAFAFYLSTSAEINKNGFIIPDSLIDSVLQAIPQPTNQLGDNNSTLQIPQINQEQIDMLKQNPESLQAYGIDPQMLDSINLEDLNETSASNPSVKNLVKIQINETLKPYQPFIPAFLAVTFFLTVNWISSILSLFLTPILWLIFKILTKTGYATFTKEMREVNKLIV